MAILCHRWWPLQESFFFALLGEPVLDAGHASYCSTYYSRAVFVARSHKWLLEVLVGDGRIARQVAHAGYLIAHFQRMHMDVVETFV
jgi:hypothetical protein